MAEIKIEKKKNNWLPWLLAILGFVLLGWLAMDLFDKDGEPELLTADEVNAPDLHVSPRPDNDKLNAQVNERYDDVAYDGADVSYDDNVGDYALFISNLDNIDGDMSIHHEYSNKALRALANSIDALARENESTSQADVKATTDKIRKNAEYITKNWKDTDHADKIREAALEAVSALEMIQKQDFPNLKGDIDELRDKANDITKETLTMNQEDDVKEFYEEAAEVLPKMRKKVSK